MDILEKIKEANLVGRGGACFPVAAKWEMALRAEGKKKFVVANGAEGEPGVKKDLFILENKPEVFLRGLGAAVSFLSAQEVEVRAVIYLNPVYYRKLWRKIKSSFGDLPVSLFEKPKHAGYVGGEESSALNAIEGQRIEPRLRPPFPPIKGLYDCPTIINNIETFYNIGLIIDGRYEGKRFYTVSGEGVAGGVYELPADWSVSQVLEKIGNYPSFPFFAQIGGDAAGEVRRSDQLDVPASGAGSIRIYRLEGSDPKKLIFNWLNFFVNESCGQCAPCREGSYRLREILQSAEPDWALFGDILFSLTNTAFCGLGCALPIPIKSYVNNILKEQNNISYPDFDVKKICDCLENKD